MTDSDSTLQKKWYPVYEFSIHVLVGTLIFLIIAGAAVGISLLVEYVESNKINRVTCFGLKIAEYVIFGADISLFTFFIISSMIKTGRKIWAQ